MKRYFLSWIKKEKHPLNDGIIFIIFSILISATISAFALIINIYFGFEAVYIFACLFSPSAFLADIR